MGYEYGSNNQSDDLFAPPPVAPPPIIPPPEEEPPHLWFFGKAKAWCKHSATILWARIVALLGLIPAILEGIGSVFDIPAVSETVRDLFNPKYVPYYIIAIALVTEFARRRTLKG